MTNAVEPRARQRSASQGGAAELPVDGSTTTGRILLAAATLFAERGVSDVTVEDVLGASSVSRRTFYKYFSSRDDVLVTLHRTLSERFLIATEAASQPGSLLDHVERTVGIFLVAAQRGRALFRVLQAEAMRPTSPLAARRRELFGLLVELHVRAARARGASPNALVVHGALAGVEAILHRVVSEGPLEGERLERARGAMSQLLLAALGTRTAGSPQEPEGSGGGSASDST